MSDRITIDVADEEFAFIKAAIEHKTLALISYMERCRDASRLETMRSEFPVAEPKRRGRPPLKKARFAKRANKTSERNK
jgi:hypothetical protein